MPHKITESADRIEIVEARGGGRFLIQAISAGLGSSGYYPASTLRDAAERRIFPAGTQIYADHPDKREREDRPERTIRDLIGALASDAYYDETTKALVAEARIYSQWRPLLVEAKDDVGLSIRATANASHGESEGYTGLIIWDLLEAKSVDFVTKAGRDGKILQILESAREIGETAVNDRRDQLRRAVRDAYEDEDRYAYVLDFDDTQHTVWFDAGDKAWQQSYSPAADDMSVALIGQRFEVRPITTYHPVTPAGQTQPTQEADMPNIEEARLTELTEAANRVPTLETERDAAVKRAEAAEAEITKSRRTAFDAQLTAALTGSKLPEIAQTRVRESLAGDDVPENPKDAIEAAVKRETDYAAAIAPAAKSLGFNGTSTTTESAPRRTKNAWGRTIKEA